LLPDWGFFLAVFFGAFLFGARMGISGKEKEDEEMRVLVGVERKDGCEEVDRYCCFERPN
jgi:hypothetical protein